MLSHLEYWINKPHFRFNCLPLKSFFQSFSPGKQCRDRNFFPVHSLCTSVLFPLKTKFGNNPVNGPLPNGRCLPGNELGLLGRFPFDQIFRFEIPGIPWDEWNSIFRLVGLTNPKSCTKFRAKIRNQTEDSFTFVYLLARRLWSWNKRCILVRVKKAVRAVHSSGYDHISGCSHVFLLCSLKLVEAKPLQ